MKIAGHHGDNLATHKRQMLTVAIYGHARVSTTDQDLTNQEAALRAAGCDLVRSEKRSGTSTTGRTELQILFEFLQKGDVRLVARIDRLARSVGDL